MGNRWAITAGVVIGSATAQADKRFWLDPSLIERPHEQGSKKGMMATTDEQEIEQWRKRLEDRVTRILLLLEGTDLKKGLIYDHGQLMADMYGDPESGKPGVKRDMLTALSFKSWLTHTLTAVVSIIFTAIATAAIYAHFGLTK